MIESAEIFGFQNLPYTAEDVSRAVKEMVKANRFAECYLCSLLYLTGGAWNLNIDAGRPAFMIAVWEWASYLGEEALAKGIRANISSYTRHHPNVAMTKAKIAARETAMHAASGRV